MLCIIDVRKMTEELLHNPTAGEVLKEELLDEMGISQNALARAIFVPPNRINEIVRGKRSITADTDIRLCKFFGLSQGFFLGLQTDWEVMEAKRNLSDIIDDIKPYNYNIVNSNWISAFRNYYT